jgi:hypothetical protein
MSKVALFQAVPYYTGITFNHHTRKDNRTMSQSIVIRFEPESNVEFVGGDCVQQYEQHIKREVEAMYPGVDVELRDDSPMGTKVQSYGFEYTEESEVEDVVLDVIGRAGNNLDTICN